MNPQIEKIYHRETLIAIIIPASYADEGIHFFTPKEFSQQLAFMGRAAGYQIVPHVHNLVPREITYTQEVLLIRKGRIRIDFYSNDHEYLQSRILESGDVILLAQGGHGIEMLEEAEIIEVKQGPYAGDLDKAQFDPK